MPQLHEFKSPYSATTVFPAGWTGCTRFVLDMNDRTITMLYQTYETHADAFTPGVQPSREVRKEILPDLFEQFLAANWDAFLAITQAADEHIAPELTAPVPIPPGPPVAPDPEPDPE